MQASDGTSGFSSDPLNGGAWDDPLFDEHADTGNRWWRQEQAGMHQAGALTGQPGRWADDGGLVPSQARNWAMGAHLSSLVGLFGIPFFVGPLVAYLLGRDRDPFTAHHAREALNFSISLVLYTVAAIALIIATLGIGLLVILPALLVAIPTWLALTIRAAVKAADGTWYRYPLTIRLVS